MTFTPPEPWWKTSRPSLLRVRSQMPLISVFPGDQPYGRGNGSRSAADCTFVGDDAIALDPSVRRGPASAHLLQATPASVGPEMSSSSTRSRSAWGAARASSRRPGTTSSAHPSAGPQYASTRATARDAVRARARLDLALGCGSRSGAQRSRAVAARCRPGSQSRPRADREVVEGRRGLCLAACHRLRRRDGALRDHAGQAHEASAASRSQRAGTPVRAASAPVRGGIRPTPVSRYERPVLCDPPLDVME